MLGTRVLECLGWVVMLDPHPDDPNDPTWLILDARRDLYEVFNNEADAFRVCREEALRDYKAREAGLRDRDQD